LEPGFGNARAAVGGFVRPYWYYQFDSAFPYGHTRPVLALTALVVVLSTAAFFRWAGIIDRALDIFTEWGTAAIAMGSK